MPPEEYFTIDWARMVREVIEPRMARFSYATERTGNSFRNWGLTLAPDAHSLNTDQPTTESEVTGDMTNVETYDSAGLLVFMPQRAYKALSGTNGYYHPADNTGFARLLAHSLRDTAVSITYQSYNPDWADMVRTYASATPRQRTMIVNRAENLRNELLTVVNDMPWHMPYNRRLGLKIVRGHLTRVVETDERLSNFSTRYGFMYISAEELAYTVADHADRDNLPHMISDLIPAQKVIEFTNEEFAGKGIRLEIASSNYGTGAEIRMTADRGIVRRAIEAGHAQGSFSARYGTATYVQSNPGESKVYRSHARALRDAMVIANSSSFLRNYVRGNRTTLEHSADPRLQPRYVRKAPKVLTPAEREVKFKAFLDSRAGAPFVDKMTSLEGFPIPENGTLSSRTWGIEVEAAGARGVNAPRGWDAKYDGSLQSAYGQSDECENDHSYYNADGSTYNPNYVSTDECDWCSYGDDDEDTREFVSPILHSFHSRGLKELVERLSEEPQNDSAGIHVHVGAKDLTPKQIGSLVYGYQVIEPILEPLYHRHTREYCKRRYTQEVMDAIRAGAKVKDLMDIPAGDRYVSLNLVSLRYHGTVEFRAMGPVYEYEHLIRWAHLARELVNVAANGATVKDWNSVNDEASLRRLLVRFGSETVANSLGKIGESEVKMMEELNNTWAGAFATVGGEV